MDAPPNANELVTQFVDAARISPELALQILQTHEWDLSLAMAYVFDNREETDEISEAPEPSQASVSNPSESRANTLSSSAPKRGGIKTLKDIGSSGAAQGHEHGDDDDNNSDTDFFTGGEKSGLAVHSGSSNPQDQISRLLDRARRNVPRPGADDDDDDGEQSTPNFTGRGITLGGDDAPSRVIEDPNANTSRRPPRVERTLHFWEDGFSIDDGPLFRYDDPANQETLRLIHTGRAPVHLLNIEVGQEVDVKLDLKKDQPYVKPKPKYKAFSGEGHRLGSPTTGSSGATESLSASAPVVSTTVSSSSSAASHSPSTFAIDESLPTVSLQIRLGNGTRLQSRFNTSNTIGDVYNFVSSANTDNTSRSWVLMTTFPSKELDNKASIIGDLAEFKRGGVIVQKWT